MTAYERHSYSGDAADTTLSAGIDDTTLTVTCADLTGWPDGTGGDFFVIFEPGKTGEEKCLASARSGNTLTLRTRGVEGTAGAHAATTTTVRHGYSARDADEANYAVSQTVGKVAAKGDLLYGSAANTFAKVSKGSAGQVPVWQTDGSIAAGVPTLAESDITDLEDDLAAKLDAPATGFTLGALLVGKDDGTADTLSLGAAGGILAALADGSLGYFPLGADGTVLSVSGGALTYAANPSGVLGSTAYATSVSVPTSKTALDTTNLSITFIAPASGKVLLRIATLAQVNGFTSFGWYTHGTTTTVGSDQVVTPSSSQTNARQTVERIVTGLTAGQSYHLDLTGHGGVTGGTISDTVLTAWAV